MTKMVASNLKRNLKMHRAWAYESLGGVMFLQKCQGAV